MNQPKYRVDPEILDVLARAKREMDEGPAWMRDVQRRNAAIDRQLAAIREGRSPKRTDKR